VRVIPISTRHIEFCKKIVEKLAKNQIRADIDDREESIGKKIRDSETEWIPYALVIGDNEVGSEQIVVRDREAKDQYNLSIKDFIKKVALQVTDRPYLPLNLPTYLSLRPKI
jgi:threonyl-tRNA synthetase